MNTVAPIIPPLALLLGYSAFALWIALLVAAVLTLVRSTALPSGARAAWTIALVVLPLVGSIAWLAFYALHKSDLRPTGADS